MLVDLFCNDELVQKKCQEILTNMRLNNNDLQTVDLMNHINTDDNNMPAIIDEHGNVSRKTTSFMNQPIRVISDQEDAARNTYELMSQGQQ